MSAAEQKVRAVWERVFVCDGSYRSYPSGTILFNWANHRFYDFPSWDAALAFTEARLEEIRQLRYEISLQKLLLRVKGEWGLMDGDADRAAVARTITRLESILADLTAGMRPEAIK